MSTLEHAIEITAKAYKSHVDKGGAPYILHPLRVMLALKTPEARIVAVLHDVVEDGLLTLDELRAEGFSEEIVEAVDAVSRREGEPYEEYVKRAKENPIGRLVKLADLRDNLDLSRIPNPTERDHERTAKYRRAILSIS